MIQNQKNLEKTLFNTFGTLFKKPKENTTTKNQKPYTRFLMFER